MKDWIKGFLSLGKVWRLVGWIFVDAPADSDNFPTELKVGSLVQIAGIDGTYKIIKETACFFKVQRIDEEEPTFRIKKEKVYAN